MAQPFRRYVPGRSLATIARRCITLGCLLVAACHWSAGASQSAAFRERFLAGRLAHQTLWRACEVVDSTALIVRSQCGPSATPDGPELTAIASPTLAHASGSSIDSIRRAALVDLRWHEQSPAGLDRAVAALDEVVRRAPEDSVALNDLAVASLAQAEHDQQLRPLLRALDAVERAREVAGTMPAVLFNRALILERLRLLESAQRAWKQYLTVEQLAPWRDEARQHLQTIEAQIAAGVTATPSPDLLLARDADSARREVGMLSRATPQWGREAGFAFLGAWGDALTAGDSMRAALALSLARAAADGLRAPGRDSSLSHAIATIDAHRQALHLTRALARGHAAYVHAYALYLRGDYDEAIRVFGDAEARLTSAGSPAALWAALYKAVAQVNRGDQPDAALDRIAATATSSERALQGKAIWVQGLTHVRRGAYETANQKYREAVRRYQNTGETENLGMLATLLAEGLELAGQSTASRAEGLRALSLLSPYRNSVFLSNQLAVVANHARADGFHRAALAVLGEILGRATRLDRPQVLGWARSERAQNFLSIDAPDSARAELVEASHALERMNAGVGRDQFQAALTLAEARLTRRTSPATARDQLARVVDAFRAGNNEPQLPNALHQLALAARDAGDTAAARRALEQAVTQIETRHTLFTRLDVRTSFFEAMEAVYDAMIALELDAGRPAEAFRYLERARAASWTTAAPPAIGIPDVQRRLPAGTLLLEYAVLPDRVVIWSITRDAWRPRIARISRDSIAALAGQFDAELDRTDVPGGGSRALLFDLLMDSTKQAREASALIVVPDRELSTVPFAALWNRRTSRYLVEDATVRTLPSAAFVAASSSGVRHRSSPLALVVGDPAFDSVALPDVGRLPGAAREAARIAELYPRRALLTSSEARRDSTISLLHRASVFHFAGHAISNLDQPELSYLALAASESTDGLLRAREIAAMRLSNLDIVVLSGCSTLGARATHVGTLAGLAYSFLSARAPAIVSTLWDVDDDATTPLLVVFHRRLASGASPAEALRWAQREALHSETATLRAPKAWAAFVYTGP